MENHPRDQGMPILLGTFLKLFGDWLFAWKCFWSFWLIFFISGDPNFSNQLSIGRTSHRRNEPHCSKPCNFWFKSFWCYREVFIKNFLKRRLLREATSSWNPLAQPSALFQPELVVAVAGRLMILKLTFISSTHLLWSIKRTINIVADRLAGRRKSADASIGRPIRNDDPSYDL